MTWIDLAALLLVALAVWDGARAGLASAAVALASVALAAWLAAALCTTVEPYVEKVVDVDAADLTWLTHTLLFVVLLLSLLGAASLLRPMLKKARFPHDGWPGGLVGGLSGLLAVLVVISIAAWGSPRSFEEQLIQSSSTDLLVRSHDAGLGFLYPHSFSHRIEDLRQP